MAQRTYKYTKSDIDVLIGVLSYNGGIYIIPVEDLAPMPKTQVSLKKLEGYFENWDILYDIANQM